MMIAKEPFFMTDKTWYYFDKNEFRLKLTDKASEEAMKSYEEFYASDYDLFFENLDD